jgi:hypothetical protein
MNPGHFYRIYRDSGHSTKQIESYCRQILSLCEAEDRAETERLKHEVETLVLLKKLESKEAMKIDAAPGYYVTLDGGVPCGRCGSKIENGKCSGVHKLMDIYESYLHAGYGALEIDAAPGYFVDCKFGCTSNFIHSDCPGCLHNTL